VTTRFNKANVSQNFPELIRERPCALRTRSTREDVSVWFVARWQRRQVINERLHERQHNSPSCFACAEGNLACLQIDRPPREFCQVAKPLAEIQAEKHDTAPLLIITAGFQDVRQISSACFLSRVFVERKTRLLLDFGHIGFAPL
jgi:hypothetical protein